MPSQEGFFGAFARLAGDLVTGTPDAPRNAWQAIAPFVNDLTRVATQQWLPYLFRGIPCEIVFLPNDGSPQQACPSHAIAACVVCRKPVCPSHSFVSRAGQAVCFRCVQLGINAEGGRAAEPPPHPGAGEPKPPDHDGAREKRTALARARKLLGVRPSASFDAIKSAHIKKSFEWHPDRNAAPDAARRFQKIQDAFLLLKAEHEKAPPP